jgi:hypothetical protein
MVKSEKDQEGKYEKEQTSRTSLKLEGIKIYVDDHNWLARHQQATKERFGSKLTQAELFHEMRVLFESIAEADPDGVASLLLRGYYVGPEEARSYAKSVIDTVRSGAQPHEETKETQGRAVRIAKRGSK